MEIKNVALSEIHWSIGWNASQQANSRLKDVIGDTSKYFARLMVGSGTYNWTVDAVGQWKAMGTAPTGVMTLVLGKVEEIRREVYEKLAADENLASKICQVPNYEEYIFYKENADGGIDIAITGWGFHNFKKAGPFKGGGWPPLPKMYETVISFVADGTKQPARPFYIVTPMMKKSDTTNEEGIKTFKEYPGVEITVIDEQTQKQFTFTTTDANQELAFDVSVEKPPVEEKPEPVKAKVSVVDAKGAPVKGAHVKLSQGDAIEEAFLNDQGVMSFPKETFALDKPVVATITTPAMDEENSKVEFTLEANENDYVLQQNLAKKGNRTKEIIAAILLVAALAALVILVFKPVIDELASKIL